MFIWVSRFKIGRPVSRLEQLLPLLLLLGCATTDARWEAGVTRATDEEPPAVLASSVAVYVKKGFSPLDLEGEKRFFACRSMTLLRKMGLLEGPSDPPPGRVLVLGEITTEEYPRDAKDSRITGSSFKRSFGFGGDELDLFQVRPSARSIEKGLARLRQLAAAIGADEVRDVYFTGYAEHQMWEGAAISLSPTSTESPIYANVNLLDFKLRDVRFHGTAVRRRSP